MADRAPDRRRRGDAVLRGVRPSFRASVVRRPFGGASSAPVGEPGRRLPRDRGRDHVAAFELAVAYLVAGAFESGDDPAAAGVDQEPPVLGSVRDKDTRRACLADRCQEPRREGEHLRDRSPFASPSERA